jgi:hypothetical protein
MRGTGHLLRCFSAILFGVIQTYKGVRRPLSHTCQLAVICLQYPHPFSTTNDEHIGRLAHRMPGLVLLLFRA